MVAIPYGGLDLLGNVHDPRDREMRGEKFGAITVVGVRERRWVVRGAVTVGAEVCCVAGALLDCRLGDIRRFRCIGADRRLIDRRLRRDLGRRRSGRRWRRYRGVWRDGGWQRSIWTVAVSAPVGACSMTSGGRRAAGGLTVSP